MHPIFSNHNVPRSQGTIHSAPVKSLLRENIMHSEYMTLSNNKIEKLTYKLYQNTKKDGSKNAFIAIGYSYDNSL